MCTREPHRDRAEAFVSVITVVAQSIPAGCDGTMISLHDLINALMIALVVSVMSSNQ
jgi:hypothetical protein